MANHTRTNAWNNGGTFSNPILLWYAKGVGVMQSRKLSDTSSWWFFGAIHGENIARQSFPGWGFLPSPPSVPVAPLPSTADKKLYWNQCQHQSWYFTPWHRGYLIALEKQVRAAIVSLGGPSDWALPYWNYFGPNNQFQMPPAFGQKKLPDGSPNPLYVVARYGPDADGNIYIPTKAGIQHHPNDPNFANGEVKQTCMSNDIYTGSDVKTKPPGFGGPKTQPLFSHNGGTSGNLENNPHNLVHVYVGNQTAAGKEGLMSDPRTAALDPIFYLHHANIDRMWAAWNVNNQNPNTNDWLKGPAVNGERKFAMPLPGGVSWVYTPAQMSDLGQLDYTYDDLQAPPQPVSPLNARLMRLGAPKDTAMPAEEVAPMITGKEIELVGASPTTVKLETMGAHTTVQMDPKVRSKVSQSLTAAATEQKPDRVYLELENVRGQSDAHVLSVYVNLPPGAKPADHPELLAGSAGLFGLSIASEPDGTHGGQGLNFVMDITKIVDDLHLNNALDTDHLNISIVPRGPIQEGAGITVGRVNIYRQGE